MIRCNHCGTDNLDGSEYCDECGTKLAGMGGASAGPPVGSLRPGYAPPPQLITQVAPPPPSFTRDVVTPKPATPYVPPPPPPPIHQAETRMGEMRLEEPKPVENRPGSAAGGGLPPPPPIPNRAASNPPVTTAPPAPLHTAAANRPAAPPASHHPAFNGQPGGRAAAEAGNDGGDALLQVRAKLVIQRGGKIGKEFPLVGAESMIGRWDADGGIFPDVDLDQDDPEAKVSRRHARIQLSNNQFVIEDLGSTNGTFINRGPRLLPGAKQPLNHGDEIIVGKTFLKFILN
jgi:FHA domain/zinc-ribbon domain